jgi:hypothetical protein
VHSRAHGMLVNVCMGVQATGFLMSYGRMQKLDRKGGGGRRRRRARDA